MSCIVCYLFFSMFVYNKKALCIIHNAYIKLILVSNIFYLFWRARKMRGHPVTSQNSGNTFAVCFSDTSEIKKSSSVSEMVLWGVVFREKNFFRFDFDFALDNFGTKSILNFGFTKSSFKYLSISKLPINSSKYSHPQSLYIHLYLSNKVVQDIKFLYSLHHLRHKLYQFFDPIIYPFHLWEK